MLVSKLQQNLIIVYYVTTGARPRSPNDSVACAAAVISQICKVIF